MITTYRIYMMKRQAKICCFLAGLVCGLPEISWSLDTGPVILSGSIGFNYRLLDSSTNQLTTSKQALGTLHASSYIWRPWFATTDGSITATMDQSDYEQDEYIGTTSSESQIVTGNFSFNMLPQSRAPFTLRYQASDSRVDNAVVSPNTLVVLADDDFSVSRLEARQAFITNSGNRFQASFDQNNWSSSRNGNYRDELFGLDADIRFPNQHLLAKGTTQTSRHSRTDRRNENVTFDLSHFYTASSDKWRVDTKVSSYQSDRWFDTPGNTQDGRSNTNIEQFSSFMFWRPNDGRLTMSGGVRLFDINGENVGLSDTSTSASATLGAIYQFTKRLRLDVSAGYSSTETDEANAAANRQRIGALYQSDLFNIYNGFVYRWYSNAYLINSDEDVGAEQTLGALVGHSFNKLWFTGEASSLRLNVAQTFSEIYDTSDSQLPHRFTNSGSIDWSHRGGGGTTLVQVTASDAREIGTDNFDQQLINFQAFRSQTINGRSSLSGNITLQYVRYDYEDDGDRDIVTSRTARIDYQNIRLFGIPRLRFNSGISISDADNEERFDRSEWENRLDYAIGQLTSTFSIRLMDLGIYSYNLSYFQIRREF